MKRTPIVEMNAQVPFDEEMSEVYDALSPEEQTEKLQEMRKEGEKWLHDNLNNGADVTVNVYVSEEDAN